MSEQAIASREMVEQVVRRVYIDGGAHITVAQEGATDIADALLAAGVFRSLDRVAVEDAIRDELLPGLGSENSSALAKDAADAVLNLLGGP